MSKETNPLIKLVYLVYMSLFGLSVTFSMGMLKGALIGRDCAKSNHYGRFEFAFNWQIFICCRCNIQYSSMCLVTGESSLCSTTSVC